MAKLIFNRTQQKLGNNKFGVLLTLSGKIYSALINYIILVLIARLLTLDDFGVYSFFLSLVTFSVVISSAGSENILLSLVAKQKEKGSIYYHRTIISVFSLVTLSSMIVVTVLLLSQNIIGTLVNITQYSEILVIVTWVVLLQAVIIYFRALNQAEFLFVKAIIPENFIRPTILFLLVILSFVLGLSSLKVISFTFLLSFLVTAVLVVIWKIQTLKEISIKDYTFDKQVLRLSPQFMSVQLLNQASNFIPVFLMGIFLTSDAIGIFRASQQTSILVSFILISVNMVFAPTIASLYNKNKFKELKEFYTKTTRWTFVLGGYITLLVILNADLILHLFGPEYTKWSFVLIILAIGQLINASTGSSGYMLLMTKNQKYMIFFTILQFLFVVILSLFTVKYWGVYGIALSVATGNIFLNFLQVTYVWLILNIHPITKKYIGTLLTILASTSITICIQQFILNQNNILNSLISSFIFTIVFLAIFVKIGLSNEEKNYVASILRPIFIKIKQ